MFMIQVGMCRGGGDCRPKPWVFLFFLLLLRPPCSRFFNNFRLWQRAKTTTLSSSSFPSPSSSLCTDHQDTRRPSQKRRAALYKLGSKSVSRGSNLTRRTRPPRPRPPPRPTAAGRAPTLCRRGTRRRRRRRSRCFPGNLGRSCCRRGGGGERRRRPAWTRT